MRQPQKSCGSSKIISVKIWNRWKRRQPCEGCLTWGLNPKRWPAPWKPDDEALYPEAGACVACPKRSSHAPDLFAGELDPENSKTPPGDRCLDRVCWGRKAELFLTRKAEDLRKDHPDLVLLNNDE